MTDLVVPFCGWGVVHPLTLLLAACAWLGCSGDTDMPEKRAATTTANEEHFSSKPLQWGEVLTFHSAILGQERVLNVRTPHGYSPDSAIAYPVVYLLDGGVEEDFPHIAGLLRFMDMYQLYPMSIVVGIANNGRSRYRDFTHPTRGDSDRVWVPEGGGSEAFIRFLDEEVHPVIENRYRTNGHRTIMGQSFGGLLVMEVLFRHPDRYDEFIAVSPSFWWDNGSLAAGAEEWARRNGASPKRVFMALARDDDWMRPQAQHVAAMFRRYTHPPFRWTLEEFPKETHATILHRAAYRALEWMGQDGKDGDGS